MGKRKKRNSNTPWHKRMDRSRRLQAAPHWIPKYNGKNLVKGNSKHFAVNHLCAVYELEQFGYQISDTYKQNLKQDQLDKQRATERRKVARKQKKLGRK
ncbi:hypothetical protein [Aquibacillus sediminis]|uniref:hypothetical protein n=1 Tax=Aquibacillus sediminis TaxID=2574734 RepID=UPI001108B4DC|nr:hypothetical protein [Aquibacillus sediminis]